MKVIILILVLSFIASPIYSIDNVSKSPDQSLDKQHTFGDSSRQYKKIKFIFLAGVEEEECNFTLAKEILLKTDEKISSPFLKSISNAREKSPQNTFYARIVRSSDDLELSEADRLISLMTGTKVNLLQNEIFITQLSWQERIKDSIIEQLSTNGDRIWISPILKKLMKIESNEEYERQKDLQQREAIDLNSLNYFSESLEEQQGYDIILAYDNTVQRIKNAYGPTSKKTQEAFQIYNKLIEKQIQMLDESSILIIVGGGKNEKYDSMKSILQNEEQPDSFSSFFFAYSKKGFRDNKLIRDIRQKNNMFNFNSLQSQGQINSNNTLDPDKNRKKQNYNDESKSTYRKKDELSNELEGHFIEETNIASTLAALMGINIPAWNSGSNLLDIYPKGEIFSEYNQLVRDSYNTLMSQVSFFLALQEKYRFFTQQDENTIKVKGAQIISQISNIKDILQFLEKNASNPNNQSSLLSPQERIVETYIKDITDFQIQMREQITKKKETSIFVQISSIFIILFSVFITFNFLTKEKKVILKQNIDQKWYTNLQFFFILPLSLLGFGYFSYFNAQRIDIDSIQICLAASSILILLELLASSFKCHWKAYLAISILIYSILNVSPYEIGTAGIFCHLLLRIGFSIWGVSPESNLESQKYRYELINKCQILIQDIIMKSILFVIIYFYSTVRLLSFKTYSPILDALFLIFVFLRKRGTMKSNAALATMIGIQYAFNFHFDEEASTYAYNTLGVSLMFQTLLSDIYKNIKLPFSFNKFFALSIVFSTFSYFFAELKGNPSIYDSILCCFIYFFSSFLYISALESDDLHKLFQQNIARILKQGKQAINRICNWNIQLADNQTQKLDEVSPQNKSQDFQYYQKIQSKEFELRINENQNEEESIADKQLLNQKNMKPNFNQQLKESSPQNKENNYYLNCKVQSNNFLLFALVSVLQFAMISIFSAYVFADQFYFDSTKVSQSKLGLILFSFVQVILSVIYSIFHLKLLFLKNKKIRRFTVKILNEITLK